jgi:hypothetical protein
LDATLTDLGYEARSPTLVQVASSAAVLRQLPPSRIATSHRWRVAPCLGPDQRWVVATGRLAPVGNWGGVHCMAVRRDVRRRGYATAVLRALLDEASRRGIAHVWLQVVAANVAAHGRVSPRLRVPLLDQDRRVAWPSCTDGRPDGRRDALYVVSHAISAYSLTERHRRGLAAPTPLD